MQGLFEIIRLNEAFLCQTYGFGLQVECPQIVHALRVPDCILGPFVPVKSLGECKDPLIPLPNFGVTNSNPVVDLCRLYNEGLRVLLGNFYDVVVIDCCPFELPLVLLAMGHDEPPLDLHPGVEQAEVLVLVVVEKVLKLDQLILLNEL